MSYCTWNKVSPFTLSWVGSNTDNPSKAEDPLNPTPAGASAYAALQSIMTGLNVWSVEHAINGDLEGLKGAAASQYDQNMPCMADGSMPGGALAISYVGLTPGETLATDDTYRYIATNIYNVYSSFDDALSDFANYISNNNGRGVDSQVMGLNNNESLTYRIAWGTFNN